MAKFSFRVDVRGTADGSLSLRIPREIAEGVMMEAASKHGLFQYLEIWCEADQDNEVLILKQIR
jgi:hypothetical protein